MISFFSSCSRSLKSFASFSSSTLNKAREPSFESIGAGVAVAEVGMDSLPGSGFTPASAPSDFAFSRAAVKESKCQNRVAAMREGVQWFRAPAG